MKQELLKGSRCSIPIGLVTQTGNRFSMRLSLIHILAYDYAKLNGRIVEKCGTQAVFAERMGLSERTISMKLNNKIAFKQPEIQKALEVLDLASDEIQAYFFTMKVQNCLLYTSRCV